MAILTVGTGGTFKTIAAAVAASKPGDTVTIEAGVYVNDFITIGHNLVLEAPGGIAKLVATTSPPNGKAIITEGGAGVHVAISGLDISGAKVKDGNGAAIRYEGGTLTLNNMNIHDNENGLLAASDPAGTIAITGSTFTKNGTGTGATHNIYVNHVGALTVANSTITGAVVGHQIKSRATATTITNSTIGDGPGGNASYEIDLPNGGVAKVANNVIQKGPAAQNPSAIAFGAEGNLHPASSLAVTGNTIVNTFASPSASAVRNFTGASVEVTGNALHGWAYVVNGAGNASGNTILPTDPLAGGLVPPPEPPPAAPPVVVPPPETPPIPAPPPVATPPVAPPPAAPPPEAPPPIAAPPIEPPRAEPPPAAPPPAVPPPEVPPVAPPPIAPPPVAVPPVAPPPGRGDLPPDDTVVELPPSLPPPTFIRDATGTPAPVPQEPPVTAGPPAPPTPPDEPAALPDLLPTLPRPVVEWVPEQPGGGVAAPDPAPGGPAPVADPWNGRGTADLADTWLRG